MQQNLNLKLNVVVTSAIVALSSWRQEDQEFRVILTILGD